MQHIVQEVTDTLTGFVDNEDQRLMIIESEADEAPLLLKSFGIVEESETQPDIFLTFPDDFNDTRRYVEMILERQREQIEVLNTELEKQDKPQLEQIPAELFERNKPSHERLAELMLHIRKIIEPERQVIWIFYPLGDVTAEEFYLNLFAPVADCILAAEIPGTKIIIRDTPAQLLRWRYAEEPPNEKVFGYRPRVDFKSVMAKMEERAKSPDAPVEEKVQAVMLSAGMDVAEKRYDDALTKNLRVLDHYKKTGQKQNESVVQNNIGDIYYLQGDYPAAQENYEKAITIAVEEESQPMVMYQGINAGNALFMQQKYDEAFVYYDSSEKLADINKVLPQRIQAMERMGDTRRAQGQTDEAIEIYEKAADICRENKYTLGLRGVLERLCEVHAERRDQEKYDVCKEEFDRVTEELKEIDPHLVEA
jgi:tetratricopeptide (TPR) repeat protein